jgi:predicted RNase H-like HicB family nuclease
MHTLRLYLENVAGDWFGWIEDHPGAYCRGATPHDAERAAPRAFADYLKWHKSNGEPLPPELADVTSADFETTVVETVAGAAGAPWEAPHFLPDDARHLGHHDLKLYIRLLRYSRTSLVQAAASISPHEWDTAPPGERSIRACLLSLAEGESIMLSRIGIEPTLRTHPDPLTTLGRIRAALESAAAEATERRENPIVETDAGIWSLSKVLRLAVWHERHCAEQIAVRSNPTAYMRSVMRSEAVVHHRDVIHRSDNPVAPAEEKSAVARHTHASGYYY